MVQRRDRTDAALEQPVDEPRVEVDAGLVRRRRARRLDARPRDGEAVGAEAELGHQVEVALPAVVVVAGDIAGVAVPHLAGRLRERVPDRRAAAVLVERALHLIRGRRGAEREPGREHEAGVAIVGGSLRLDRSHAVHSVISGAPVANACAGGRAMSRTVATWSPGALEWGVAGSSVVTGARSETKRSPGAGSNAFRLASRAQLPEDLSGVKSMRASRSIMPAKPPTKASGAHHQPTVKTSTAITANVTSQMTAV